MKNKATFIIGSGILVSILFYAIFCAFSEYARAQEAKQYQSIHFDNDTINKTLYYHIGKYYIEKDKSEKYSDSLVLELLDDLGCYYPDLIMAQLDIESGKGTSKIAHSHNNLFGMKKAFKRPTCRNYTLDHRGYSHYYNWQLSVIDRLLWDFWTFKEKPTRGQYLAKLQNTYAENPNYTKLLIDKAKKYQ